MTTIENPFGFETPTPNRLLSLLVILRDNLLLKFFDEPFCGEFDVLIPCCPYYKVFWRSTLSYVEDILDLIYSFNLRFNCMTMSSLTDEPLIASKLVIELCFLPGLLFYGDLGDFISSNDDTLLELPESSTILTLFLDI